MKSPAQLRYELRKREKNRNATECKNTGRTIFFSITIKNKTVESVLSIPNKALYFRLDSEPVQAMHLSESKLYIAERIAINQLHKL